LKVAVVCSYLNQYGGAERVLDVVHTMFPAAPIYTSIFWPQPFPAHYREWDIRPSFLNRLPLIKRHHQPFLPLYPAGFESLNLDGYDLVLSVTSGFAHGVITHPGTTHICYCLTPARFLWYDAAYQQREQLGGLARLLLRFTLPGLRTWDVVAAQRVDHFVAISRTVQARIQKFYHRQAPVIYPPVDCAAFGPSEQIDDYYLIVSRLIPYKRIDLAVRAFSRLGLPLVIVGDGRDRAALERLAGPTVRFVGRVSDAERKAYMAHCRAFVFPGEEDFGITPLEAHAAGRPVIAYAAGGALDTVVDGVTGAFFHEQTVEALASTVASFRPETCDPQAIRRQAERFDVPRFKDELNRYIARVMGGTELQ
jgi:glycosyltransferase involved in cell wall biosynthesis